MVKTIPRAKKTAPNSNKMQRAPATTPEGRENHCIALAYDLVEQRLREGTASSQETTHFLKMGSMKERLEKEKLMEENKLLRAKTEALQSAKRIDELYTEAIKAMREYGGHGRDDHEDY